MKRKVSAVVPPPTPSIAVLYLTFPSESAPSSTQGLDESFSTVRAVCEAGFRISRIFPVLPDTPNAPGKNEANSNTANADNSRITGRICARLLVFAMLMYRVSSVRRDCSSVRNSPVRKSIPFRTAADSLFLRSFVPESLIFLVFLSIRKIIEYCISFPK